MIHILYNPMSFQHIHITVQLSPQSNFRTFSITLKDIPHSLAIIPCFPLVSPLHMPLEVTILFSVYRFTYSRHFIYISISQYQFIVQSCLILASPWTVARQASLSITDSRSLLKLMSIQSMMPSHRLILCRPLLLLPSIFPCIRVFSNESVSIMWPKNWSFSFSISPSSEYSGLISFSMDWLDLFAVQGTLKSLLQHHSSRGSFCISKGSTNTYIWNLERC